MNQVVSALVCIFLLSAMSSSAVELSSPTMSGMGGCVRMTEPSAFDLLLTPGAAFDLRSPTVDLYDYDRFNLDEIGQSGLAVAFADRRYAIALGIVQFGNPQLYRETAYRSSVCRKFGPLSLGATGTFTTVNFGQYYAPESMISLAVGAAWHRRSTILSFNLDDLNSPRFSDDSPRLKPRLTGLIETWPKAAYSVAARFTAQNGEQLQFGVGQLIRLPLHSSLFWGVSNRPLIYGAGLEIFVYKAFITCTASYHPVLGMSRMITLSFRGDGTQSNR